jgi:hypothetical protein
VTARYQLSPVRDARERDERVRRAELADAVDRAHAARADLAVIAGRIERGRAAIADATARRELLLERGAAAHAIAGLERYVGRLRRELESARDEQLRAEALHRGQLDAVDVARERLVRARAEREVIERHFAAWRAERQRLAERRED